MGKGRRYNGERKLNVKKVVAVIVVFAIIILFIFGINQILKADKQTMASKNIELNYMALFTNGNWGVINSSGEEVVQPAYSEMIAIPNKQKPVFICTYDVNYVDGTYRTKAINDKNQDIFTDYENVATIQNLDKNNNLWFEENVLKVQKDGKFGLINLDGKEILPCEYDSITTLRGIKNSIIIKKDGKIGLVNTDGSIIVPVEYADISAVTEDYKNGYIVKNLEGKFGIIKSDGQVGLESKFEDVKHIADNNMYIAKLDGTWKVIAEDGTAYLEGKVNNAVSMNNGNVVINNNGKYGIVNVQTDLKIPSDYEFLAYIFEDKYIAKKDGKFGVIDTNNQVIVELKYADLNYNRTTDYLKAKKEDNTYDYMTRDFAIKLTAGEETVLNGFISVNVQDEVKYYNYKLEEKSNKEVYSTNTLFVTKVNGKYGFVNKDGKVVVEAIYDDATEQNDYGYVAVKKDGKWGAIDQYGKVVIEPTYMLSNNKRVEFVGKWHNSADANANYFTDEKE